MVGIHGTLIHDMAERHLAVCEHVAAALADPLGEIGGRDDIPHLGPEAGGVEHARIRQCRDAEPDMADMVTVLVPREVLVLRSAGRAFRIFIDADDRHSRVAAVPFPSLGLIAVRSFTMRYSAGRGKELAARGCRPPRRAMRHRLVKS